MKKTKKIIALLLALMMVFAIVAGCGTPDPPAPPPEPPPAETPPPPPPPPPEPEPAQEPDDQIFNVLTFARPGTYITTVQGFRSPVIVRTEFSASCIVAVEVLNHGDTAAFAMVPIERIPAEIVRYQTLAVDTVTGATATSMAILSAVWEAAEEAGGDLEALIAMPPSFTPRPMTLEADVVVVGSGISGLMAAAEANRLGADVIVIEKLGFFGGTTATNGGIIQGVNNPVLRADGYTDSPQAYYEFLEMLSLGQTRSDMRMHIANTSQRMIEWTIAMGVQYRSSGEQQNEINDGFRYLEPQPLTSPHRRLFDLPSGDTNHPSRALWANSLDGLTGMRTGDGSFITIPMVRSLANRDMPVRFFSDMRAESLIQPDGPGTRVTGVIARDRFGAEVTITADSVILATGGFHDNAELMEEFHPMVSLAGRAPTVMPLAGANGDGIILGRAAGAATVKRDTPIAAVATILTAGQPQLGMFVTPNGVRFHDEAFSYPMAVTAALFDLGYHYFWAIMNDTDRRSNFPDASPDDTPNTTPGAVFTHDTLEGLAALIGLDPVVLAATRDNYDAQITADAARRHDQYGNANPAGQHIDDFASRTLEHKSPFAVIPAERHQVIGTTGPFWAQRSGTFGGTFAGTRGGLKIDVDGRVLQADGTAIPGLFAAGEVANAEALPLLYGGSGMALNVYATMAMRAGQVAVEGYWSDNR